MKYALAGKKMPKYTNINAMPDCQNSRNDIFFPYISGSKNGTKDKGKAIKKTLA